MKYESPKYEMTVIDTEEILASSEKYKIEEDSNGSGSVIMNAIDIFG